MNILLAPMEGVIDHHMRELLTAQGGYHRCVTEFVRVTDQLLPGRVFRRLCPELANGGRTRAGTPVVVQLLGGIPEAMAANAQRAAAMGAPGIDINFGCPSKFVNRNAGGAVLLKEPQRIHDIVHAVRNAVAAEIPVTAKIRLGYDNTDLALDNAHAVQAAGADCITVHARTKTDGYKPPARWEWLACINEALTIPVIANGDINSVEDYQRCREISGCEHVMIGRGAIACPNLAHQIQSYQQNLPYAAMRWSEVHSLILSLATAMQENVESRYIVARIKQWLKMLKGQYPEAQRCFEWVRVVDNYADMECFLRGEQCLK
ncbi:MAG: tRNA-dihydrouridine synthase [Gammaproteobacteria bacterium]|nr:tRNA-dihydrouridine synthase [Gammaproteobacteria bacterium]